MTYWNGGGENVLNYCNILCYLEDISTVHCTFSIRETLTKQDSVLLYCHIHM